MTDDLRAKADRAWAECRIHLDGSVPPIRAAVEASIAAALSTVLEKVERLEEMLSGPSVPLPYAAKGEKPKTEGAPILCDTPGCGRPIPEGGEGHPETCPTCLACLKLHDVDSRHADANRYHQSLGAKWMCEAIMKDLEADGWKGLPGRFARKWEDSAFWRPKTSDTASGVASGLPAQQAALASSRSDGPTETGTTPPAHPAMPPFDLTCSRCGNPPSLHGTPNTDGRDNCGCPPIPENLLRERPPAPPATQAPERVELVWDAECRGWVEVSKYFAGKGVEYVRSDVHAKGCADSRRLGKEHAALMQERRAKEAASADATQVPERVTLWSPDDDPQDFSFTQVLAIDVQRFYVRADLLSAAERRIAELEKELDDAVRVIQATEGWAEKVERVRAEGRVAGIREAADAFDRDLLAKGFQGRDYYRAFFKALLDKKPEGT